MRASCIFLGCSNVRLQGLLVAIVDLFIFIAFQIIILSMSRRRNSTMIDDRAEQMELQGQYKKTPHANGGVTFYDYINILKNTFVITEQQRKLLLKEIGVKEIKVLDFGALVWAASFLKRLQQERGGQKQKQQSEYYDAFVALGGNPDKTGFVSRSTLMKTIIDEFGMSLDMDSTIEGLQGLEQERLNYDEFCDLFKNSQGGKRQENPEEENRQRTDTMKTVQINIEAFNEYLSRLEDTEG